MFRKAMFILFPIAATAFSVAVQADCVGANGQSRSGKYEYYSINPKTTDYEHYVRTTLGPVTVQVNVQGSYNNRGDCPASKDNLYFSVHWTKRRDAYGCLDPSNRGPGSFLSCYFKAKQLGPGGRPGKWFVRITNPGVCTVDYRLVCWNGKQRP